MVASLRLVASVNFFKCLLIVLLSIVGNVMSMGVLILHHPIDVSSDCAFSHKLRYDISFGSGMSDTITLVFRTLSELDYECVVEIVTDEGVTLLFVIKYPNLIVENCDMNPSAFTLLKKNTCVTMCDLVHPEEAFGRYFSNALSNRLRFRFASNSSLNFNMNAVVYQVTATSARTISPNRLCNRKNETECIMKRKKYCFTSGVVCDGIKNCGVSDWYDEHKADCGLPIEYLKASAVFAAGAVLFLILVAGTHLIKGCLPPVANSFFIFNENEDNRLCIQPVMIPPSSKKYEMHHIRRTSLIPDFSSSSDEYDSSVEEEIIVQTNDKRSSVKRANKGAAKSLRRTTTATMRTMTAKLQKKILSYTTGDSSKAVNQTVINI